MKIINATNVNDALVKGSILVRQSGVRTPSRNGDTLDCGQVTTVYKHPYMNVLWYPKRAANHLFHFIDAMWCIAGRKDLAPLEFFNKRYAEYSDDGKTLFGSYGARLREQLCPAIKLLESDPDTRRCSLTIALPYDVGAQSKDIPCNTGLFFRVRNYGLGASNEADFKPALELTVTNRSNDMVWGLYGANAVQFSFIQLLFAQCLGIEVGTYTHFSNSFHVYLDGAPGKAYGAIQNCVDDLVDQYQVSAEVRLLSRVSYFSRRGSTAEARLANSVSEIDEMFYVALVNPTGEIREKDTRNTCRAALMVKLAFHLYALILDKKFSEASMVLGKFEERNNKCHWTVAFGTQINRHFNA